MSAAISSTAVIYFAVACVLFFTAQVTARRDIAFATPWTSHAKPHEWKSRH